MSIQAACERFVMNIDRINDEIDEQLAALEAKRQHERNVERAILRMLERNEITGDQAGHLHGRLKHRH
jgi:hypothetical protein